MSNAKAVATFSIVARDPATGDLGVATASKFLAVGAVVPFAEAAVGAVATQSYANTSYGPRTIASLRHDIPLRLIHEAFTATDDEHAKRQYGLVDARGNSLTFTGDGCHPWAGGTHGDGYAAQGNLLTGPEVIQALVDTYLTSREPFAERLLSALQAGDDAGGDQRGRQSAALLVVRENGGYGGLNDRYVDLRVDDHPQPIPELRRLLSLQRLYFEPPAPDHVLTIDDELSARLQRVLQKGGYLSETSDGWNAGAEQALRSLAGVENLEERMLEPGQVDKVVLDYLEQKYR
jgi:uncharacterized Ntn-hydrolase superfamily protein